MNVVIEDGCISCGVCADTCPDVFEMGDSGMAEVIGDVTEKNAVAAREAAEGCPVSVIRLEE